MGAAHVLECEAPAGLATVDDSHKPSTSLRLVRGRCEAAEQASCILHDALGSTGTSLDDFGARVGVSKEVVRRWADPSHQAAVTLRDLIAGPPRVAEAVLELALVRVRERETALDDAALRRVIVALCVDVGQVLELSEREGVTRQLVPVLGRLRERAGVVLREAQRRLAAERSGGK